MNIVGKILVILNLVFAVAVGGFLVVDFATRTDSRDAFLKAEKELKIRDAIVDTHVGTSNKTQAAKLKVDNDLQTAREATLDAEALLKAKEDTFKLALDAAELRATDAQLTMQKYLGEKDRLIKENKGLSDLVKSRDETLVKQQADIVKFRNAAVAMESAYAAADARLQQARERILELEKIIAQFKSGGSGKDNEIARGKPNPPMVYVEGKIDLIHKEDTNLVQISVGSDKGLVKNHTLEVYRADPKQPLYLGMIRIVDVQPHEAVGRLERISSSNRVPLRVGDTVASTLSRN